MTSRGREITKAQSFYRQRGVAKVEGLLTFADCLMQEATDGLSTSYPPKTRESDSNTDLFEQVETFEMGEEEEDVMEEKDHYRSEAGELRTW